jgi:hypothetical protein
LPTAKSAGAKDRIEKEITKMKSFLAKLDKKKSKDA